MTNPQTPDVPEDEATCLCCCRPLSEHNAKRQCLETTYFIPNVTPRPTQQPAIVGGVDHGVSTATADRLARRMGCKFVPRTPAPGTATEQEAINRYYPLPLSFHEAEGNGAAWIRDASGGSVAMLMWAAHGPEDEDEATEATYAVGRAFAAALTARPSASVEVGRLMHVIDRDRYVVAHCIGAITDAIRGRAWLLEGRGPYEWDDDRYREEFADAVKAIEEAVQPLRIVGWDKSDCTRIEERVNAAKLAAREMLSKPLGPRGMIEADIFGDPRDAEIDRLRSLFATPAPVEPGSEREAFGAGFRLGSVEKPYRASEETSWNDWQTYLEQKTLTRPARPAADDAK